MCIRDSINAVRIHDVEGTWFDQNAVCGLVFYGTLTVSAILLLTGNPMPAAVVLIILFGVPLIIIMPVSYTHLDVYKRQ